MGALTCTSQATQDLLEDVEWIAQHGGTLHEAAERTGRETGTVRKILARAGRGDLLDKLQSARPGWRDYLGPEALDATRRACRRKRATA